MTRLFTLMALCGILVGAAGCGRTDSGKNERVKIGMIAPVPNNPWFQLEWKFADEAAKQYDFDLQKLVAESGEQVQTVLETWHTQGVQGVVICAPDVKLGPSIIKAAKRLNLKLMSVDDQMVGPDGKFLAEVPHVGIDARNIGKTVGQGLADEMKKRGWKPEETAAMGITYDQIDTCRQRTTGAAEVLEANGIPHDRIFMVPRSTPDQDGAFTAANDALTAHPGPKNWLVFSSNDDGVLGAVRAMKDHRFKAQDIIGIGIDGAPPGIGELKKELTGFYGTVLLQPKLHGFNTCEAMYKWITTGTPPPKVPPTTGVLVDRSNFVQKMQELGLPMP